VSESPVPVPDEIEVGAPGPVSVAAEPAAKPPKKPAKAKKEEAPAVEAPKENLSLNADDIEKPKIVKAKGSKNVHTGIAHVLSTFSWADTPDQKPKSAVAMVCRSLGHQKRSSGKTTHPACMGLRAHGGSNPIMPSRWAKNRSCAISTVCWKGNFDGSSRQLCA